MRSSWARALMFVVSALLLVGGIWAAPAVRCHFKTDGESIGGFPAETYGEYAQAVRDQSGGCTDVILVDANGTVVDNPSERTLIKPVVGAMLSEPILVHTRQIEG